MLESLLERFRNGERQALSRLLTLSAAGPHTEAIRAAIPDLPGSARTVAFTGSAGVGKSSLMGKLIGPLRDRHRRVAVLACDPQSSLTGGALLADRIRMPGRPNDSGVFVRSLAAEPGHQALATNLDVMIRLLSHFGFDLVVLETTGAGQGDTAVADLADVVVLLVQPGSGDEFQWEKAGLLEIADVLVVHKADLPGADWLEAELRRLLHLPDCRELPILRVSSLQEQGLEELIDTIETIPPGRSRARTDPARLLRLAQQRMAARFRQHAEAVAPVIERWKRRQVDDAQAAEELLRRLSNV